MPPVRTACSPPHLARDGRRAQLRAAMTRRRVKLVLGAALAATAAAGGASYRAPARRPVPESRVVAPLADPALVPGVARCTSDGICFVTDASGTRRARLTIGR
jgi:hypothetical protein